MALPTELPLFPLDMVLLPYRRVPLHIFEERYKQLIGECMADDTEFGIVRGADDDFEDIGCAARVIGLINRFSDGRMNILIEGTRRFCVMQQFEIHPYISGFVEDVEDEDEEVDLDLDNRARALYAEALKLASGWHSALIPDVDPEDLAYVLTANLNLVLAGKFNLSIDEQQALLESTSSNERLAIMSDSLEHSLATLREVKRRTHGNGHLGE